MRPGYSGVAIYSKRKPDRVITGFGVQEFDSEGRYLEFQFGRLSVVSLYLPSGSAGPERQASKFRFLDAFLPYLKKLGRRDRDYVLCGDINIAHREIDLKNWKSNRKNSGFLPEERAWLDRVFGELKWVDAFREVDPRPEQYTWWSNRGQARAKNVGWRIDYQIASRSLAGRARAASIYRDPLVLRPRAAHDGLRAVKAWAAVKPYLEKESLAAFFVGVSSGFPYAMIGATLTTRLAQDGIDKRTVTAFTLAFLVYNLKVFWAWIVDGVRIPLLGRLGQRVSWLLLAGAAVIAAVVNLALVDPAASIQATVIAAVLVGIAGATYDIVIDAYRIETLKPSPARRRVGHVAVRLAHRLGRGGRARAGGRGTHGLGCGLYRLRGIRPAGDADRADRRRARAARRDREEGPGGRLELDRRAVRGVPAADRRLARAAVHPRAQDRRHARAADRPPAVQRPWRTPTTRSRCTTSGSVSGRSWPASSSAASSTRSWARSVRCCSRWC